MRRRARLWATLALIAAATTLAVAAQSSPGQTTPAAPDSTTQPLADGCQRDPAGLLTFTSPEWVYVYRDPSARLVEGVAHSTHTASGDLPEGHDWYDLNSNINVDSQYSYLLGSANYTGTGEETGRLHVEWESGSVPKFVWPTENDRVKLWGSWVWDCGHWGQSFNDPDYFLPGQQEPPGATNVPGERTEFHPMRAMVVTRADPYRPTSNQTESDAYISTAGTIAHAEAQCAYEHPAASGQGYGPDYTACVQDQSKRWQPANDQDYTFFVPAPPKPNPNATLTYRVVDMSGGNGPQEQITPQSNGIQVTVPMNGFGSAGQAITYGKSFFVGWSPSPTPPQHIQLKLNTVTVFHSLDPNPDHPSQTGVPPGEYNLYLDANGYWQFLNDWVPGLGAVSDGQTFTVGKTVDLYVPQGKGVRVFTHGRECDLPKINPCPDTSEVADDNDVPGDAIANFSSVNAALGKHTLKAASGNYQLTYQISLAK